MWDKEGVFKEQKNSTEKIGDCGFTCTFVGYNKKSGDDVYMMWNPVTNRIYNTCDIIWLKMMFYQDKLTTGMVKDVTQFDDL